MKRWALHCTMDAYLEDDGAWDNQRLRSLTEGPIATDRPSWHIADVDDEIAAVDEFKAHIAVCGEEHVPYVYMVPWQPTRPTVGELLEQVNLWRLHPSHIDSLVAS